MFERLKADILFNRLFKRPDIDKAYAMVGPEDSWYETITTVHNSLAKIRQLPHEDWQITSHDGLSMKGLFYPGTSNKTMIWVHGYTSHAERESAFPGLFYHNLGFNVLIPYLRAHGPSEGKYIAFGALEYQDIKKWVDIVNDRLPDGKILIHGLSMGGGIALDLSTQEMRNVACLVVDAPSWSIEPFLRDVSDGVFKKDGPKVAEQLIRRFQKEFSENPADYNRVEKVRKCRYPILLSAGSNEEMDDVFTQICNNCPSPVSLCILPGCNHGNGMYKQTQIYQSAIRQFIEQNM